MDPGSVHVRGVVLINGLAHTALDVTNFAMRHNLKETIIFSNGGQGNLTEVTLKDVADKPGGSKHRCLVTFYFAVPFCGVCRRVLQSSECVCCVLH